MQTIDNLPVTVPKILLEGILIYLDVMWNIVTAISGERRSPVRVRVAFRYHHVSSPS